MNIPPYLFDRSTDRETDAQQRAMDGMLLRRAQAGDERCRNRLIRRHARAVVSVVNRYQRPDIEDELLCEGVAGLNHAITKASAEYPNKFLTYALFWVRAYISRYIEESTRTIRLPSNYQSHLKRAKSKASKGEALSRKESKILELWKNSRVTSISEMVSISSETLPIEATLADDAPGPDAGLDERDTKIRVQRLLQTLSPKEKAVVWMAYGLDGREPQNLAEVGRELDLSRERVRQIEMGAIKKMGRLKKLLAT